MKKHSRRLILAALCAVALIGWARAADEGTTKEHAHWKGPISFILDHKADLSLTADQESKLTALKADVKKQFETVKADPNFVALKSSIRDARTAGKTDEVKKLHAQMKDLIAKEAPLVSQARESVKGILSKDQMGKLTALRKEARAQRRLNRAAPPTSTDAGTPAVPK
jgi:Spy/CpxP family protein refolding chaperone